MIKSMAKRFFYLSVLSILILLSGCSQKIWFPTAYNVNPDPLQIVDNKIDIEISGRFLAKTFDKKSKVVFTPIIEYEGKKIPLKTMVFKGENSSKTETNIYPEVGPIIPYAEGGNFTYNDSFTFTEGMEDAAITVTPIVYRNNDSYTEPTTVLTNNIVQGSKVYIVHDENLLEANRETAEQLKMDLSEYYETVTLTPQTLTIFFNKNSSEPIYTLPMNKANKVYLQLNEMSSFINKDTWKIKDISIVGYCSPDDEEIKNPNICLERANTGKKILNDIFFDLYENLKAKVKIKDPETAFPYYVEGFGPDWNNFTNLFQDADMPDKTAIVNIINSHESAEGKQKAITEIAKNNKPFDYRVLSALRRVEVTVNSYAPKLTNDSILEKALANPSTLFNKELFYAAQLTDDIKTQEQIYTKYIELFPTDWKGYVNLANIKLKEGNITKARDLYIYASKYTQNNPIVLNNLGVCMFRMGKVNLAKQYFYNAFKLGVNVRYNSALVSMYEEDYVEAEKLLGNLECNLNKALIYMHKEDYENAKKVASCTADNYDKYYVLALIAAKEENTNEVIKNISKAVEYKPHLKDELKLDGAFYEYRYNPKFYDALYN